jgi:hypothetical protein
VGEEEKYKNDLRNEKKIKLKIEKNSQSCTAV